MVVLNTYLVIGEKGRGGGEVKVFYSFVIYNKNGMKIENWRIEALTGYKPITSFYIDFSIADRFGIDSINDTFNRAFKDWKHDYKYITELSLVLNWKIWRWHEVNNDYAKIYDALWRSLNEWCIANLQSEELEYYYRTTD